MIFFYCLFGLLLYGPLFPWSPFKLGFKVIRFLKADLIVPKKRPPSRIFLDLNTLMEQIEELHQLKYKYKVKIIICFKYQGWFSGMQRFLPWFNKNAGGMAIMTGDTICINYQKLNEKQIIYEELIRHELSHSLLQQNSGLWNSLKIASHEWFSEGIATYFQGPNHYTETEFIEILNCFELVNHNDYNHVFKNFSGMSCQFKYTYYRFFIKYLIDSFGLAKLHDFMNLYIKKPSNWRNIFIKVYHQELLDTVKEYDSLMRNKSVSANTI